MPHRPIAKVQANGMLIYDFQSKLMLFFCLGCLVFHPFAGYSAEIYFCIFCFFLNVCTVYKLLIIYFCLYFCVFVRYIHIIVVVVRFC